jgi:hypothetical protein
MILCLQQLHEKKLLPKEKQNSEVLLKSKDPPQSLSEHPHNVVDFSKTNLNL